MEIAGLESLSYEVWKSPNKSCPKRVLEDCLQASSCFEFHSLGSLNMDLLASLWVDAIASSALYY